MDAKERANFDAGELAVVLSYYDLGVIESITDFPRGSRRSPKVGIVAEKGKFLLKRRAIARAKPDRVKLAHKLQAYLATVGFPLPKLVETRVGRQTCVQLRDHLFELFEFVAGQSFERTADEAADAGRMLGRFHTGAERFAELFTASIPQGDFHDASGVRTGLCAIRNTLKSHDSFSGNEMELDALVEFLLGAYDAASDAVNERGFNQLAHRLIHSDWHPGNILFKNRKVVAVVDYDSVRQSRWVLDVANGALQFSMLAGGDPATWPDHLDLDRYQSFLTGYGSVRPLAQAESRMVPHLMAEALIAECVPPITETGSVGQWAGFRVMQMARRKLTWLAANAGALGDV